MRITKPEWLRHDADKKKLTAIFSLDFHPDGKRLATAGMDNKIRLWSTQAIAANAANAAADDAAANSQRLLATLASHSGAVMCVRFSHGDGRFLASGADDMVVLVWERDEANGDDDDAACGNLQLRQAERWRPVRRLTGHASDVCDVAWAPGNRFLASCGLDNTVLVWDGATFERVARLTGHAQFVKGLAFDPAGKFLATQSDDRTLRVWRTSDWAQHAVVGAPFEDSPFSTFFRRPSWSPDGDCVAAANAANGKAPVAAVISRADWAADLSFVGHRAAIEAVRFNPRVFARSADPADPADPAGPPASPPVSPSLACVCAAGGQDRGVSVWLTSQHMPIAAATHLFSGNLMDLAWHTPTAGGDDSDDSRVVAYLAACSYDGTVAMLEFTQAELGRPISAADQEALLIKHGWIKRGDDSDPAAVAAAAAESRRPVLAESVEQLRLEERGREILLESAVARDSRIAQIMDGCLKPSTAQSKSEPQAAISDAPVPKPPQAAMSDAPVPVLTKSGKKRVAPVFVRPLTGGSHAAQSATTVTTTVTASTAIADDVLAYNVCSTTAASALPSSSRAPVLVDRVAVDAPIWIEARALGTRTMRAPAEPSANGQSSDPIASITATVRPLGRQTLIHSQSISAARVHLSVPRIVAHVTCTAMTTTQASLTAYNKHQHQKQQKIVEAKIVCSAKKPGAVVWTKHLTGCAVALLAASDVVAAASCTDGTLHLFDSESGARLLPPIMFEAHLAHLRCVGRFCLALDCVGQLTVWDVDRVCAVVDHVSVAPLLYSAELIDNGQSGAETEEKEKEKDEGGDDDNDDGEGETVKAPKRHKPSVALTAADVSPDTGAPIVCLSDGRSFSYHLQLRSWLRIGDPASYAGSDFAPLPPASLTAASNGTQQPHAFTPTSRTRLGYIQETGWHQRNLSSSRKRTLPAESPAVAAIPAEKRQMITLDHLEHQLMAAGAIESPEDVQRYADILARHLARSGDVARATFWVRGLLGPALVKGQCPTTTTTGGDQALVWEPTLAGIPKRQLLARVLPILATNRNLQSVVTEYSAALEKLTQ